MRSVSALKVENPIEQSPFHGLLLIDKPSGCSSHDVVAVARKIMGTKSIGHAGTLDPLASGLLILLVGEGTKISAHLLNGDKGYELTLRLGVQTDTLDITGHVIAESAIECAESQIRQAIMEMQGELNLAVPKFSAVKVDGKTLYKEARNQREFEAPIKTMKFYDLEVKEVNLPFVKVRMRCSKGSYIRSWANELGRRLGCGACVQSLRRNYSSPYQVDQATTLEKLQMMPWESNRAAITLADTLPDWPFIVVDGKDRHLLSHGQLTYGLKGRLRVFYRNPKTGQVNPGVKVLTADKELLGLLEPTSVEGDFKIARMMNIVT